MMAIVRVTQEKETDLMNFSESQWGYHYAYSRSAEARELGDIGQDYLTLARNEKQMVFVLCDGISMSYHGDLAAVYLGDRLRQWLITLDEGPLDEGQLTEGLDRFLKKQTKEANKLVEAHQLPVNIKGLFREVMLDKKKLGSSTMYACGRIDFPSTEQPKGRMVLAWQGDIRIRLWSGVREQTQCLGNAFYTREQWNSQAGPVGGVPRIHVSELVKEQVDGTILLYSDGLQALDQITIVNQEDITNAMKQEADNPSSDDMAVFQMKWHFV